MLRGVSGPLRRLAASALLAGAGLPGQGQGKPPPAPAAATADQLILELRLGPVVLDEGFPALAIGGKHFLPLGALCQDLDLAVQTDPGRGLAQGFLIDEGRRFHLEAGTGILRLGTATLALDRAAIVLRPDDLYVEAGTLAKCLPLDLVVDPALATATLQPREELPIQARWRREGHAAALGPAAAGPSYAPAPDPYRFLEWPAVDATLTVTRDRPAPGARATRAQGSLVAAGDLLWMSASAYGNVTDRGGLADTRLTLGRKDPHGGLFRPLKATEFQAGDILGPGLDLLVAPWSGNGMLATNQPLTLATGYDRQSFVGVLLPGWQVELYQNRALIAFQASRADGRYEFMNVPLSFGSNEFNLVFYGPQGQQREEHYVFDINQNQVPVGQFRYLAAAGRPSAALESRSSFLASYGLTSRLTASLGQVWVRADGRDRGFTRAALDGFGKTFGFSLAGGLDGRGGQFGEAVLRSWFWGLGLDLRHAEFGHGFSSEALPAGTGGGPMTSRTSLALNGSLPGTAGPRLTFSVQGQEDRRAGGGTLGTYSFRTSTQLARWFLSNTLAWTHTQGPGAPDGVAGLGTFLASKTYPALNLRLQGSYGLQGDHRLQAAGLACDLTRLQPFTVQVGVTRTLATGDDAWLLNLTRSQGRVAFGGSLGWSRSAGFNAAVTLRTGTVRNPLSHRFVQHSQGVTGYGAVAVTAFLDQDGDGRPGPREQPVRQVGFLVNQSPRPGLTDPQGRALLDNLVLDQDLQVAVNPATLEDPLMRAQPAGFQVTPRAGHVTRIQVPLVVYSEISGITYLRKGGVKAPLPGLRLELRDAAGKVVRSLRSAYDGFFSLADVAPGTYTLAVPEAAAERLGAKPPASRRIVLAPEGTLLDGLDLVVEGAAGPDP